ncbi:hypothetical protein [Tropicimonas marinistellae]|uniref:hypothetical protein n=1 Tax=Tropicimonas marinistellae TaxID=1739787 RepID=UPI00082CAB46|nr:hypothetical protein [Tropicimonas marinistellae]
MGTEQPGNKPTFSGELPPDSLEDKERREVLKAVQKYAAFVAGTSTVVLTADEAVAASSNCSRSKPPGMSTAKWLAWLARHCS